MLAVGLWLPGFVFTCFGGGRLVILFEVEEVVLLLLRGAEPDFEDPEVDIRLFSDFLTAITEHAILLLKLANLSTSSFELQVGDLLCQDFTLASPTYIVAF